MGNCGSSLNCTQCYNATGADGCTTEIDVDPDIAGFGVLVAFFLSAVITCIAIFLGYVTDSLPPCVTTQIDISVIGKLRNSTTTNTLVREKRQEAITRLVLALSDQQLVTGTAIMVAALANRCTMTVHEFQIVESLVWFSATTHLATLPVLREYMYAHPFVRNCRVVIIYVFLALFGTIEVFSVASKFRNPGIVLKCVLLSRPPKSISTITFEKVTVYSYLLWTYTRYILQFYLKFPLETNDNSPARRNWMNFILKYRSMLRSTGYASSFLRQLTLVAFSMTFGVSKTVNTIWIDSPKASKHVRRMGFGQVVAIALITLPLLTAAEIYNEMRSSSQTTSPHDGTSTLVNNIPGGAEGSSPQMIPLSGIQRANPNLNALETESTHTPFRVSPSPQSDVKLSKLSSLAICGFIVDMIFMLFAGIIMPTDNVNLAALTSYAWALRMFLSSTYVVCAKIYHSPRTNLMGRF